MFLQLACLGAIILYKMDSALDLVISEKDSCYLEMQLLFTNDKMQELCGRLFQNQYPTVQCYPDSGEGFRKVTKQKKWCWYDSWHIIITVSVCLSHVNVHAKTAHTYTCMQACMHTHTHTRTYMHASTHNRPFSLLFLETQRISSLFGKEQDYNISCIVLVNMNMTSFKLFAIIWHAKTRQVRHTKTSTALRYVNSQQHKDTWIEQRCIIISIFAPSLCYHSCM